MAVKFFGQYLVETGVVPREAIVAAIGLQEQKNLKLGELAVALGYATAEAVESAHRSQLVKDRQLGDLLVDSGVLTGEQLQAILVRQKETHLFIGEALVHVGALTPDRLKEALENFRRDQAPFLADHTEIPGEVPDAGFWGMAVDLTYKMITRVLGLRFRPGKCRRVSRLEYGFMAASLELKGDVHGCYQLSVSAEVQKQVARAILREASVDGEPAEVLEDAVMEFCNVVCGNVAAKASQDGIEIAIEPPRTLRAGAESLPVKEGQVALCFPIHLEAGETMELYLVLG